MLRILVIKQRRLEQLLTYSWTPGFDHEEAKNSKSKTSALTSRFHGT